ncbi:Chemotaxis signal transduction protein [Hahella chejuensis KCTC 2396]|uniref:Chemotaxis signal transduction protein n=1 Tax=Hahella chejuensis (strain KCTC 2396) TaxID=349521 RepID=Q2SD15_HAHCH|nr:chemotaxis protein CheV [Hahella chejuensis]ABC31459.1 Chemotaxis signal transduction protein [Hahella chejuensis KCTC 2396]
MASVLDSVDQRTKLVGENRLELLLFKLGMRQIFAINVFKIQEVLKLPNLTQMPHRHPVVCGVSHIRDTTVPVINLSQAIGFRPLQPDKDSTIIVTEYNRTVQAFLVASVDRIVNMTWEQILPPPKGAGGSHYVTAITHYNDQIVEIIDVERVLADIRPYSTDVSDTAMTENIRKIAQGKEVLLVDDSPVAISQAIGTLQKVGLKVITARNGLEAYNLLKKWADEGVNVPEKLLMVVTDAEMPAMDGYRLTTEIRNDPRLKDLYVVLHTSLSGSFNKAMVEKVGCNNFLSKFQPDELAAVVQSRLNSLAVR